MRAFVQAHQHDAHGGPALAAHVFHADAHHLVGRGQHDEAVVVTHGHGAHHGTGLGRDLEVDDALAAARLEAVEVHAGALAEAVGGNGHDLRGLVVLLEDDAGHHHVLAAQGDALDARGHAAHGAHVLAGEADGIAVGRGQHDVAVLTDGPHHHQLVVLAQAHGHEAALAAAGIERGRGALDHAAPGHEEEVLVLGELAHGQHRGDPLPFLQGQQVVDVHALGRAAALGHLMHLELVHAALVGEQAQVLVVGGGQELLHIVVIGGVQGRDALAAALLLLVVLQAGALHVAAARQGDDHFLVGDEVLDVDAAQGVGEHLGTARRGEGLANLADLALEFGAQHFGVLQHGLEELDLFQQFAVFGHELFTLQAGQALQAHVQDGAGLHLGELETLHEAGAGLVRAGGSADQGHHFVDVVDGDAQAFQDVGAGLGLLQVVAGAADDHLAAVVHEAGQGRLEVEQHGTVVHHGQHVDAEAGLQRRVLVQTVDDDVRDGAALQVDDHADALAVGLVAQVGDAVDLVLIDQAGDLLHQRGLVEAEGDLADDDGLQALLALFHFQAAAHLHGAATGVVGVGQALARVDEAARGEVRALDHVHEVRDGALGIVQQHLQGVAQLAQVVGRDVGGHAHGDARRTVEQQVGHLGGQHRGLLQGVVVVGPEVHGLLVDVGQELAGQARHAHFRVTHGGRGVAVDGAEVALPVHQRVAHGEILGQTHQGIVHGAVAVGVVLTDDVTDDARRFLVRTVVTVGQLVLGVHDAPVHGLEAVARVGDGAPDDDRKGILQIGFAEFLLNADLRLLCAAVLFRHVCLAGKISGRERVPCSFPKGVPGNVLRRPASTCPRARPAAAWSPHRSRHGSRRAGDGARPPRSGSW